MNSRCACHHLTVGFRVTLAGSNPVREGEFAPWRHPQMDRFCSSFLEIILSDLRLVSHVGNHPEPWALRFPLIVVSGLTSSRLPSGNL